MTQWTINGKTPDESFVFRSGLKMQVTPEGDCREAAFTAQGAGLGLRPLDIVEIACDGHPIFAGELRIGGNTRDVNGHQFVVRSLALRLKEVSIPPNWNVPQRPADITVRSLIAAVLPQLGGAFTIGTISLGFQARAVEDANYQDPYSLLEQIAADGAAQGVDMRFGVNAARQFFAVPARTEPMTMPGTDLLTAATTWNAPVAETPVTVVRWLVAKRPDGKWLTHLSQSPEVARYGVRVKVVPLESTESIWVKVSTTLTYTQANKGESSAPFTPVTPLDKEVLEDKQLMGTTSFSSIKFFVGLQVDFAEPPNRIIISGTGKRNLATSKTEAPLDLQAALYDQYGYTGEKWIAGNGVAYYVTQQPPSSMQLALTGSYRGETSDADTGTMTFRELRAERLDTDLLDRLAKYHYSVPHEAVGDVEVRGIYPIGAGHLDGMQIAAYEYRITADRGLCTGILLGQADDPFKLAQAELIKARDNRATINALIAKE